MATSQNGWPVIFAADRDTMIDNGPILGTTFPNGFLAGDVKTVFVWLWTQLDRRVEPIDNGTPRDEWGYNVREIEGSDDYSNHSSGTAGDYNARLHPMGVRNTYSEKDRAEIRKILKEADGIFRWGGDYTGRPDDMHFEIHANRSKVGRVADWVREQEDTVSVENVLDALETKRGKAAVYAAVNQDKVQRYDSSGAAIKPDPDPNKASEHLMTWASALAYLGRDVLLLRSGVAALAGRDVVDEAEIAALVVAALGGSSDAELAAALKVALGDRAAAVAALLAAA